MKQQRITQKETVWREKEEKNTGKSEKVTVSPLGIEGLFDVVIWIVA